MRTECSLVGDLLPLYVEELVSPETAQFIREHLAQCPECQAGLDGMQGGTLPSAIERLVAPREEESRPFRRAMKRLNRQFHSLAYSLIIFFIFLGFGWTGGENLMYNSLIMPIVGVFGYYVFRWRAVYRLPLLLLLIDGVLSLLGLVALDLYSTLMWTLIYSGFVQIGIVIAALLHFALGKEKEK